MTMVMRASPILTQEKDMPTLSPPPPIPCEICTYPSHGYHFKVVSCRACAAFFRRSLMSGLKYVCKSKGKPCNIDNTLRYFCKFCRFQKCLARGMSAEKIQQNRDPISSTIPGPSDDFLPPMIEESVKKSMFDGPLYDFQSFLAEIRRIFRRPPDFSSMRPLKGLEEGVRVYNIPQKRAFLEILDELDFEKITKTRLNVIRTAATWLMYSQFFQNLKENEKMLILKTTWHVWGRLKLLTVSVDILGEKVPLKKMVFISETEVVKLIDVFQNNIATLDPQEAENVDKELAPLFTAIFDDVAKNLCKFKWSNMEVAYMLWQMVWCVAGRILTGPSLTAGEQFTEELATDLHQHYQDLNFEKYSNRVIKMMSVVRTLQKTYIDIHRVIGHANKFKELFVLK